MIAQTENTSLESVRVLQRKLYRAVKENPQRKFGMLYDKICQMRVLWMAYRQVKANKGAAGIDRLTFQAIEKRIGVSEFLLNIQTKLINKCYKPQAVRRVYIPKADGSQRPLGIPVIEDRIVQAAVKIIIEPLFEAGFKDFSYGFRPKKNAQQALREIYKRLNFKCHWVIDADLKSYFDTIPRDKLLLSVRTKVIDRSIIKLIELWLTAGVMENGQIRKESTGTPQGGVLSPLLANIYLHWLDSSWEKKLFNKRLHDAHLVRYADDFVILCRKNPEYYLGEVKKILDRLGLTLNTEKTQVINAKQRHFDFLGYRFVVHPSKITGKINTYYYPSPKAMQTVKSKIREKVRIAQHWKLPQLIKEEINPILSGWGNYFKTGNSRHHFLKIANYTTYILTIMLRKKHKKQAKGWRDHPPSWFYNYQGLFNLNNLVVTNDRISRYACIV